MRRAGTYTARGEAPGVWLGSGMTGLVGVAAGDPVTAEQMLNLFGSGHHPLAGQLRAQAVAEGLDDRAQVRAAWLGQPYRVYAN
ncbi:relaxase domain-containing protein [Lapillicoccus sp.]|uniref:relaxase domain-containing protein n=1 Tax=Lapillicoccus sp. TaxID=1909287 RepID=UPI0025EEC398|nr:relaxase domain-containing protein [Lapillicoccus sp.]